MNNEEHRNENPHTETSDEHGGSHERPRPSYDDVNVPVVFLVGIISMVLTFVTIWFVEGIYYKWSNDLIQSRTYGIENTIQSEMIANQKKVLDGDEDKGITSVASVLDEVVTLYHNADADDHDGGSDDAAMEDDHNEASHEEGGDDH